MTHYQKDNGLLRMLILLTTLTFALTSSAKVSRKTTTDNTNDDLLISHVNLLLPPSTEEESVTETIYASHGCFKWQNTNPDLIKMDIHPDTEPTLVKGQNIYCARSVSVTPLLSTENFKRRSSSTIIAEDQESGKILRCEVFIDQLKSIDIKTRTRRMNNGDDEVITIQGRDSLGNIFSSLEGIIFKWDIKSNNTSFQSENDSELPLKIVPFRESAVAVNPVVERLEAQDRQTSSVLVRGASVGVAEVSAVPIKRQDVEGKSVLMVVIQPLDLLPREPRYVTKGAHLNYTLVTYRNKEEIKVNMPNTQYKWSIEGRSGNSNKIAKVSDNGTVTAVKEGNVFVNVKFVGFKYPNEEENKVSRELHIVEPKSLDISVAHIADQNAPPKTLISGTGSKVLVVGHNYTLDIDAFDNHYHKIEKDTLAYTADIPSDYLRITSSSTPSNQHFEVQALKIGSTKVHATLKTIAGVPAKAKIHATKEILITAPIAVQPGMVRLPWVPAAPLSQFRLTSSGGSGEYKWYSNSTATCTVSPSGVVTAVAEGTAEITVADMRNELNFAKAVIVVSRPKSMEFVPHDAEATVGSALTLDLAVYDSDGVLYDECGSLPLNWETDPPVYINAAGSSTGVFRIREDDDDDDNVEVNGVSSGASPAKSALRTSQFDRTKACTTKSFEAVGAGRATVTASLKIEDSKERNNNNNDNNNRENDYDRYYNHHHRSQDRFGYTLEDSRNAVISANTVIHAFEQLRVASPSLPAPVTLGAEITYTLEGGAEPFYLDTAAFYENFSASEDPSAVALRSPTLGTKGVLTATCLAHSSQSINVVTGNTRRQNLPNPLVTRVDARFDCAVPAALLIKPNDKAENDQSFKDISRRRGGTCAGIIGNIVNDNDRHSEGAPLPMTYHLRNNRTIDIETVVLDDHHRKFYNSSTLRYKWTTSNPDVARWETEDDNEDSQQTLILGSVEGTAHVSVAIEGYQKLPEGVLPVALSDNKALTREFDIVLHKNVAVEPSTISVVNNPRNLIEIRAMHGSGNYIFAIDDESVARVERTTGASVRIQPLRSGVVHVTAIDACLANSDPAVATITISDVASLELSVPDLVQVGNRIEARVTALDVAGHPFDPSQYVFMDISLEVDGDSAAAAAAAAAASKNANSAASQQQQQQQLVVAERLEGGRFVLAGVAQGAPSVVATARGATTVGGRVIATAPAQVYVFPEFKLVPEEVTMVPGASYHLRWTGGPPVRYEVSFASAQTDIVGVASEYSGVITASKIGSAEVTATISAVDLITREKRVYGKATAHVLVSHLTGIRIRSATGRLVAGGEEDVWVEGLGASETPLTLGALGIRFVWSIADPHVAALRGMYEDEGYPLDKDDAPYNARIAARAPGKTTITVSIGTPLPANLPEEIYSKFSASMQLTVVEPLALVSPQSIVLPPHSAFPIRTTKDGSQSLRFHVLGATNYAMNSPNDAKTPLITVDPRGVVKTYAGFGTAVVLVSDDEGSLPQSVAVTVKPVSHLQTTPVLNVDSNSNAKHRDLVVGSVTGFEVALRDDLGQKFDALPAEDALLSTEVSDPELIAVAKVASNSTLLVRALKPGRSVIHTVLTASPTVESYATAYVGHMVEPMLPVVHVGAAISFTTSYAAAAANGNKDANSNSNNNNGYKKKKGVSWYTDDTKVMKIDGTTGSARALAPGHCSVYYNGTTMYSHTDVTVAKIGRISLADGDPSQIPIITNAPILTKNANNNRRTATVPSRKLRLRFESEEGAPFTMTTQTNANTKSQINHNIQVQCTVSPAAWASAQAVSDPSTGEYYCAITPVYPAPRDEAPDALVVGVKASDSSKTYTVDRAFKLKFQPQFVVSAPHVVRLTDSRPKQLIEVRYGMATLSVAPRDPQLVEVLQTADGKFAIQPRQRDASFTTAVDIEDSATGQKESITVNYTPQMGSSSSSSNEEMTSTVFDDVDTVQNEIDFGSDVGGSGLDDGVGEDFVVAARRDSSDKSSKKWLLLITLTLGIVVLMLIPKQSI